MNKSSDHSVADRVNGRDEASKSLFTGSCPDCGGDARCIGSIPATQLFAGRVLEQPLAGGRLYRCSQCHLGFRWPRLSKGELDQLYQEGGNTWAAPASSRHDWRTAHDWIADSLPCGSSVLDVGCFDGRFLEPLVGPYQCFGVEIHAQARERAEGKGIKVVGEDFSELKGQYDCVTALDVLEHVENPSQFLSQCLDATVPGGCILISTGNLDSSSFRFMGGRYWYCTIAEHISFVSPYWFDKMCAEHGCTVEKTLTFAHGNRSLYRRVRGLATNLLYRVSPSFFGRLRRLGFGGTNVNRHAALADYPPPWESARDHFIVLLRKR